MAISQQFHQLPLFLSAREIRSNYQALDADRRKTYRDGGEGFWVQDTAESDNDVYTRKYTESSRNRWHSTNDSRSLTEALVEDGVKNPVSLQVPDARGEEGKPQVLGGHHRIAVMERHKPDALMPVEHFQGQHEAAASLGRKY